MKKKIYIHIGSPKTATSSIQNYLFDNRELLLSKGYLYPEKCSSHTAHHPLCVDINRGRGREVQSFWYGDKVTPGTAWDELIDEINSSDANNVILSSELFFVFDEEGFQIISEKLSSYEVEIVCFIRSEDQLFNSFYNQDVKGQRQWSKSSYEFYETHQLFRYSYADKVRLLESVFSSNNLTIVPFIPKDESTLSRFLDSIGLSDIYKANDESFNNQGLGPTSLYIKSLLNKIAPSKELNEFYNNFVMENVSSKDEYVSNMVYVNNAYYVKWYKKWIDDRAFLVSKYNSLSKLPKIKPYNQLVPFSVSQDLLKLFVKSSLKSIFLSKTKRNINRKTIIKLILVICFENNISLSALISWRDLVREK